MEINYRNARAWSIMGIGPSIWGVAFEEVLASAENKDVIKVLTADLERYSGLQRIDNLHPDTVYNVGIAEQNMVGIAAGFALEGVSAYMTTYAPFMTYRCADQVRHFMGNMQLPLKAIGSAAGFSAGFSGNALLALSDIAFMRSIPGIVVLNPADCTEAIKLMLEMEKINSPVYMRFSGTTGLPIIYKEDYNLEIGKPIKLHDGKDIAILSTGTNIVSEALKAAKSIEEERNISISVFDVHTIKPLNNEAYTEIFANHDLIVTVEEHSVIGGLGSAVAEKMTEMNIKKKQIFIGAEDCLYKLGDRNYMLEQAGLFAEQIKKRILK